MKVSRTLFLLALITSVCSAQEPNAGATVPGVEGSKPNIVIIFTDDQGYADLGCYGNQKNKTPRMDQLAREGTRFTSFYAQSVCGPSRSALLTGRYPIRSKGWAMPASEITFAELIRDAGYQTACIGKWDVSNRRAIIDRMPNAQGFDYYFGALGANDAGRVTFHENNNEAGRTTDMASLTTLYTDKAIDFLENRRDPNKPFVLYLSHTMMHTVIDASERFRGKSKGGLYGDVVEEFDYETGRLLDTLDELGLRKDTFVIYTTDNGPWNQPAYYESKMGLRPEADLKFRSKNKKGRLAGFRRKEPSFGENPVHCATARGPATREDRGYPVLSVGRVRCRPAKRQMLFLRPSISCQPSPPWLGSRCRTIGSSMGSIKANCCSVSARKGPAKPSFIRAMACARGSGSISRPSTASPSIGWIITGRKLKNFMTSTQTLLRQPTSRKSIRKNWKNSGP